MPNTSSQWLTFWFLIAITTVAIAVDVVVINTAGPDASISRVLGRLLGRYGSLLLALVFWLGVLVGHIWLPAK